jgi:hypothetical protein
VQKVFFDLAIIDLTIIDRAVIEDRCRLIAGHRRLRFSFFLDEPGSGIGNQYSVISSRTCDRRRPMIGNVR